MIIDRFRVDILGLSTESKPETSIDGTTFYEVDTSTLYIYYKGTWYEQDAEQTVSQDDTESEVEETVNEAEETNQEEEEQHNNER